MGITPTQGKSIFEFMEREDLTTLEIFYNRREGKFLLRGMKEWEEDIAWERYMKGFTVEDILTDDYRAMGSEELLSGALPVC